MWSVGGGKGGVGKSIVAASLAYWLGQAKHRVVLVDGDLGGANLHTLLGIRVPRLTLEDYLLHRVEDLEDALLETPFEGVRLLAGGYDVASLANPNYGQKARVLRALNRLRADHILVDLGAGTSLNVLDFFLASPHRLVVMAPQPTSIQNAYGFIKAALYRQLARIVAKVPEAAAVLGGARGEGGPTRTAPELIAEMARRAPDLGDRLAAVLPGFRVRLVVNMTHNLHDAQTAEVVGGVCQRYLGIAVDALGAIPVDAAVERWAATMDPACFLRPGVDGARRGAYDIAARMAAPPAKAA